MAQQVLDRDTIFRENAGDGRQTARGTADTRCILARRVDHETQVFRAARGTSLFPERWKSVGGIPLLRHGSTLRALGGL